MSNARHSSNDGNGNGNRGPSPEIELLDLAVSMARREEPPYGLAGRVHARVQSFSILTSELASPAPSATGRFAGRLTAPAMAGAGALGAAAAAIVAGILLKWPLPQPAPISAEPGGAAPTSVLAPATSTGSVAPATSTVQSRQERMPACTRRFVAAGALPLIDDFEDADDSIAALEGRVGLWRWARETDAPGTAPALLPLPRPGATHKNRFALHVKGAELVDWGATVEFVFDPGCYDASAYQGISFEARGPGRIYVAPRETTVIPVDEGGTCTEDCHNPHVIKIDLDRGFRSYAVRWSDLRQRGFDKPPLDATRLHGLAFLIRPEDTPYDIWIDDVRFLP